MMNYLVYNPRTTGTTGFFKELELWEATESEPTLTKYGDYDFLGSSIASHISFSEPLIKPKQIQFIVKSGAGTGQGFASCAEMQFFKQNPDNFDYLTIFIDHTCSSLKPDITEAKIKSISIHFFVIWL